MTTDGTGARRLDDLDLAGARLHSPDLEGARITDGWLRNTDISGFIEGLRVNGVDVAPLVEAELDRRQPERQLLRATDPDGLAEGWTVVEGTWAATVERAERLPAPMLDERVEGDWSFIETLRHLVMATDSWLLRMVGQVARPYHPWGLAGSFLADPAGLGLDVAAQPSLAEVLEVRRGRMDEVRSTIARVTPEELARVCDPPDATGHPSSPSTVLECLHVILNEEWEHAQYANRDLGVLEARLA